MRSRGTGADAAMPRPLLAAIDRSTITPVSAPEVREQSG
jgi:hypothetical protein